ncbi:glycosyltransferase 87 family protein [Nocardiopsis potens]|uniref:glycosyltransferase 87 family protein n=1 Tax=Nocardiopsis potens TaxID=1246458 RepID=UPI001F4CE7AF|nr:glycosyltransferase 87 family protein [Nocardiopsis potens]
MLTAYINWDLLAVALLSGGLVLLGRARYRSGGALVGLAVAAKFYPFLVFGPLLVLVLRRWTGRDGGMAPQDLLRALGGAAAAWAAVNLPVLIAAPEGWATFFTFSRERGADWGSLYYVLDGYGLFDTGDHDLVNTAGTVSLAAACALIAAIGVFARRPPRPEQLVFLVVAAFLLTNKVWSPQFVLWLVPLAVLAWPRTMGTWPPLLAFVLWQAAETAYFFGIWQHLMHMTWAAEGAVGPEQGLAFAGYSVLSLARSASLLGLCACVAADCLRSGKTVAGLR